MNSRYLQTLIIFFAVGFFPAILAAGQTPMLPQVYTEQSKVCGWLMSEKLDGVRGIWDGRQLRSKNGHLLHPPEEFIRGLPPFALEGEIWGGRGTFAQTAAVIQRAKDDEGWMRLQFAIFDAPDIESGFSVRLARAKEWFAAHPSDYAFVIPQKTVRDRTHLLAELHKVEKLGGEGLIVRKSDGGYREGRSSEVLKVKSYQDAEAVVVAHIPGTGRNHGRLGSLLAELPGGLRFKIGTGLSNAERDSPPPVGTIITFKYYGFYPSGIPKFPSFLRIRHDKDL